MDAKRGGGRICSSYPTAQDSPTLIDFSAKMSRVTRTASDQLRSLGPLAGTRRPFDHVTCATITTAVRSPLIQPLRRRPDGDTSGNRFVNRTRNCPTLTLGLSSAIAVLRVTRDSVLLGLRPVGAMTLLDVCAVSGASYLAETCSPASCELTASQFLRFPARYQPLSCHPGLVVLFFDGQGCALLNIVPSHLPASRSPVDGYCALTIVAVRIPLRYPLSPADQAPQIYSVRLHGGHECSL